MIKACHNFFTMRKTTIVKLVSAFVFILMFSITGKGQFFYYGQEPASLEWKKLNTENFSVHYTENASLQAYYYARLLEKTRSFFSKKTEIYPKKFDVIIHNRSVSSNGFSVPAPLRMEINTLAPQRSVAQQWLQQLSLHEYQHSQQIEDFRQGFARHLTWLMGDAAIAGAMSRLPFWFIEGEAVANETAYSLSGRGRDADFLMKLIAAMNEDEVYSYDKAINGSYNDYVLNYYNLGYHLIADGRKKYGDSLWRKVREETAKKPYAITPFSSAIKKYTGKKLEDFYREAMSDLVTRMEKRQPENFNNDSISLPHGVYKSYTHPLRVENGIIAYRESYRDIPAFVQIKDGKEEVLHYPGSVFDEKIAFTHEAAYWAEYYSDRRWGLQSYSVLKRYDFQTEEVKELTSDESRYFAPDVASERNRLTAVKANQDGSYTLVVMNSVDGDIAYEKDFPLGELIITPKWSSTNDKIVFIKLTEEGKAVYALDISEDKTNKILKFSRHDISHPYLTPNYLYYIAPFKGKNDLYALDLKSHEIYQLTDAKYGVNYPSFQPSGEILLSDYTARGYKLRSFDLKEALWKETPIPEEGKFHLANHIKKEPVNFNNLPELKKEKTEFKKGKHLFNFHSLTPFAYSKNNLFYGPGISVHSQNLMSSMFTSAGYYYDYDEEGGNYFLDLTYDGWYPRLHLNSSYGKRARTLQVEEKKIPVEWNQARFSAGIEIPFNFNAGNFRRFFSISLNGGYRINDIYSPDTLRFSYDKFFTLTPRIYFYNLRQKSRRDLYPRFGQVIDLHYLHSWLPSNTNGKIFSAEGWFYLPGFTDNHHLRLYSGYEYSSSLNQPFSGYIRYPRGSRRIFHEQLWSNRLNYSLPLFYPDWNIGKMMYFKRIKANLFVDMAGVSVQEFDDVIFTTGIELFADTHFLRLIAPAEPGFRAVLDPEEKAFTFEFLFRMNFNIY